MNQDRSLRPFASTLAGATGLMVGLSWPLWVDRGDFPRIPCAAGWPEWGLAASWFRLAIVTSALGLALLGRGGRWPWLVSLGALGASILGDQNRLQPWVQQFLVLGAGLSLLRSDRALSLARWYAVVLYAASGLSKLDAAFVDELGATFLGTFGHLIGLTPEGWSPGARLGATLAMPLGEVVIAAALVAQRTRWVGLLGSVVQHGVTIAILGPWALNHSLIVLVWNAALIGENLILFGRGSTTWQPGGGAIWAAGALAVALVVAERGGLVDSWPAHALYASHAERAVIGWPAAVALPPAIERWLGPPDAEGYRRLDLTGWSRAERGVPVPPQNRVAGGIAEALVARYAARGGPPVRVILLGRSGLGRGATRARSECINLPSLRRRGDRSWLNAHPAPGFGPDSG